MAEPLENVCLETLAGPDSDSGAKSKSEMPDSPPSSSDSSDDDGEENEKLKLEALEKELEGNPSNYDAHVQYIKSLRKLGHIEKLREAREEMSSLFPLSHTMWQEWAKDEISLSTGKRRNRIWEAEHGNIREVNSEDFDGVPSHVVSAYEKAMQMYNTRVPYEDRLSVKNMSDTERFQHFMTYIKFEESCGDPARVQILYERAVTEFPISSDIWLGYTRCLDRKLKVHNVLRSVYSRATKNCTCIGELWSRYLLSLERVGAPEEELSAYLDLFLIRVDGLRRRICLTSSVDNGLKYAMIRGTFQRAAEYLSPLYRHSITIACLLGSFRTETWSRSGCSSWSLGKLDQDKVSYLFLLAYKL